MISDAAAAPQPELSWVLPVFRTADQFAELVARVHAVSHDLARSHEVVVVDDACPEGTGARAEEVAADDPRIRVRRFTTNRGQDAALAEGLRMSRGEWTVILDADLQDPPEAVASLWEARRDGVDVVFARRLGPYTTPGRRLTSWMYRTAAGIVGGLPAGAGLYALMSRSLVQRLDLSGGPGISLLARIAMTQGTFVSVPIQRSPRATGESAYSSFSRLTRACRSLWQMRLARRTHPHPPGASR